VGVGGGKSQAVREGAAPRHSVVSMNLTRATLIDRGDGLHEESIRKQESGLQSHIDAFADQRMCLTRRIADLKRPLLLADSDSGTQRSHSQPGSGVLRAIENLPNPAA
jgi:hypothetical protein